jgi:hypothetical protein
MGRPAKAMTQSNAEYSDPEDVLRTAPGPAPWYPRVYSQGISAVSWKEPTDIDPGAGAMLLARSDSGVIAIVGMYSYALEIDENRLVVWYQRFDRQSEDHSKTIDFHFLDINNLKVIENVPNTLREMKAKGKYLVTTPGSSPFSVPTDLEPGKHKFEYSPEFVQVQELLIWGHSTAKQFRTQSKNTPSLCLFILKPLVETLEIIPQDWFNHSRLDFGYQWVTRVAREPKSGKIYGGGIRISHFVLDDSLQEIEKWFYDDSYFGQGM